MPLHSRLRMNDSPHYSPECPAGSPMIRAGGSGIRRCSPRGVEDGVRKPAVGESEVGGA